jgi:hypothetical protein
MNDEAEGEWDDGRVNEIDAESGVADLNPFF